MVETLEDTDLGNLVHMLGAGTHIRKSRHGYRNYYAASSDGSIKEMERLVSEGLAVLESVHRDMCYYRATEAGCDAIGLGKAAKRRALEGVS